MEAIRKVPILGLFLTTFLITSCATKQSAARGFESVLIKDVPHVKQKPDFCGEAVTESYLRALGKRWDQDDVFGASEMDPARGMGATTSELKRALELIGFRPGRVWHPVASKQAATGLAAQFAALHADLRKGIPSIVCTHYSDAPRTTEHFRLVLGYDAATDEVIYHEPAEANGAYRRMKRALFLSLWPLKYQKDEWTVIRFRLNAGTITDAPARPRHSPAAFAQHVRKLRETLPQGFTVVVEPPFVVIGDESPGEVRGHATSTVRWAIERLKRDFFSEDPKEILNIWLFRDANSYETHARKFFGATPTTPYGYYSEANRALVMNISTGGGTLVHEIVHPFMAANFPDCPAWYNEGLGSLFEQSASRDGRIIGLTNWRLAGLKRSLRARHRAERPPSFKTLTATTTHGFYNADRGTNYAQARYLLYYLQEKGLLVRFHREFRANVAHDSTGYETLKAVLGASDMAAFQKGWEAFVLALTFP